jgi:hypothetical protein
MNSNPVNDSSNEARYYQTANCATNSTTTMTNNTEDYARLEERARDQRTDLENARALIQQNRFPSQTHLDAQVKMTVRWARELNLLERQILALKHGTDTQPSPPTTDINPATPPTRTANPYDNPYAMVQPNAADEPDSPSLSPWIRSLSFEDFAFSSNKEPLELITRQASEPIDFGPDGNDNLDPCLEIPPRLLATLDPATNAEILHLAQELRALDVHLAEGRLQQELMAEASYTAKITRFKATLEPTDALKKDNITKPLVEALSKEFLGIKQKFQTEGTRIVRKLVDVEVEFYRSSMLPTVVKGLFRIAKQAVVSRRPQHQVLGLLNMARAEHATSAPDLPESDATTAAFILLLLLASSAGPVIANYAGLDPQDGVNTLFEHALANIEACPTPADFNRTLDEELRLSLPETPAQTTQPAAFVVTPALQGTRMISDAELLASTGATTPVPATNTTPAHRMPDDGDSSTRIATNSSAASLAPSNPVEQRHIFVGNKFFPAPSAACWYLAVAIHKELEPLANHITMIQRLRLAKTITRSKCINASQALRVSRDIFSATTSVKDLIAKLDAEPAKIVGAITGWQRQYFGTLQAKLNTRFKHLTKSLQQPAPANTPRLTLPPLPTHPRMEPPPPIDPQTTTTQPRKKRKRKARESHSTDANSAPPKNSTDGMPAIALPQSTQQRQQQQRQPRNNRKRTDTTRRVTFNDPQQPTDPTSLPNDRNITDAQQRSPSQPKRQKRPRKRKPRTPAASTPANAPTANANA